MSSKQTMQRIPLGGDQLGRLSAALEDAYTLDGLRQLLRTGLNDDLSVALDSVAPVQGRTLHDVCHDLVLWALAEERVGLQGLLAAALGQNPANQRLIELEQEWAGVVFVAPACPYPGMKPFTAAERGRFYGREIEIAQAVDRLRRSPFMTIIGSSGSGKSSLLAAGILPALEASHHFADKTWSVHTMRPGAAPFDTLAALLDIPTPTTASGAGNGVPAAMNTLPVTIETGARRLLVVDQFEEMFTTAAAGQRERCEQALLRLLSAPDCYLILAARADFYANLMASSLWEQIREHRLEITPPRGDALRQAITLPARDVGVQLEPALVERLLADAGDEPGVLPFIQETLVMLWGYADRLAIGLDAYTDLVGDKSGRSGLQVALAEHADHVYLDALANDSERAVARRILVRLIQFGEGRADTRRQQTADELRKGTNQLDGFDTVLSELTTNRLVTLSDEARRVDLSHEALISGWPRLAEWIEGRRAAELTRRRLEEKAGERQRLRQGDGEGGLLDAVELAEAEAWVKGPDAAELGVSDELAALVTDSRHAIDADVIEKEKAAERLRRRNQGLAIALAAALVAVAVAAVFYFNAQRSAEEANLQRIAAQANASEAESQRSAAEANAAEAERAARRAQAGELAVYAQNAMLSNPSDPSLALLLAIGAAETTWQADGYVVANADRALRDAVAFAPPYRMTLPRHRHSGEILSTAYSPNGEAIVTASSDGTAITWNSTTGQELHRLVHSICGDNGNCAIQAVDFSPDGAALVTAGEDGTARIWDAATGSELLTLRGHSGPVSSVSYSPDGKSIVTAGSDNSARIWDAATGRELRQLTGHGCENSSYCGVNAAAFSPDGKSVVTAGRDATARIWEVATGKELHKFEGHSGAILAVAFSPDGTTIVTTGDHDQPTRAIVDSTIRIWDTVTGEELRKIEGHSGEVYSAAFSPDGETIITAGQDGTARIWDAVVGEELRRLTGHTGAVTAAAYSPDGRSIVTAGADRTARIWDATRDQDLHQITEYGVTSAAFGADGKTIVNTSLSSARILDANTGESLHYFVAGSDTILPVGGSPDGKTTVVASDDRAGTVHIWNAATGEELLQLRGYTETVASVRYSPDGNNIVTSSGNLARIWDAATGQELRELSGRAYDFQSAAYSPDGKTVVTTGYEQAARIWDAATGEELRQLEGYGCEERDCAIYAAAYSPDGRTIVTAGSDQTARIWDAATGQELRQLTGHTDGVYSAAYSPNGKTIVTAGLDGSVRIWDADTGLELRELTGHSCDDFDVCAVYTAAYSPDGKHIVTTGRDQTIRIWDANMDELLARAQHLVQRDPPILTTQEQRRYGMD